MKITKEQLESIGFDREGTELGDDGALEMEIGDIIITWIPKKGRYTEKFAIGWWIKENKTDSTIQIPLKKINHINTLQTIINVLK